MNRWSRSATPMTADAVIQTHDFYVMRTASVLGHQKQKIRFYSQSFNFGSYTTISKIRFCNTELNPYRKFRL